MGVSAGPVSASKQTCRLPESLRDPTVLVAGSLKDRFAGGELAELGAGDRADAGHPEVDPLDLLARVVAEVVAVQRAVLGVEGIGDAGGIPLVDGALVGGHPHLEGLAEVAQVHGARVAVLVAREAFAVKGFRGLGGELVERLLHGGVVERGVLGDHRLDVVVLHVDGEQAEGGDVARVLRDDDTREVEDVDQAAAEQRARAAERRQHEVAHVQAALDRDLAQRVGLVPGGDLEDAGGAADGVDAELRGQGVDAGARASTSSGISPPSRCGGIRPRTTWASVMVGWVPPLA